MPPRKRTQLPVSSPPVTSISSPPIAKKSSERVLKKSSDNTNINVSPAPISSSHSAPTSIGASSKRKYARKSEKLSGGEGLFPAILSPTDCGQLARDALTILLYELRKRALQDPLLLFQEHYCKTECIRILSEQGFKLLERKGTHEVMQSISQMHGKLILNDFGEIESIKMWNLSPPINLLTDQSNNEDVSKMIKDNKVENTTEGDDNKVENTTEGDDNKVEKLTKVVAHTTKGDNKVEKLATVNDTKVEKLTKVENTTEGDDNEVEIVTKFDDKVDNLAKIDIESDDNIEDENLEANTTNTTYTLRKTIPDIRVCLNDHSFLSIELKTLPSFGSKNQYAKKIVTEDIILVDNGQTHAAVQLYSNKNYNTAQTHCPEYFPKISEATGSIRWIKYNSRNIAITKVTNPHITNSSTTTSDEGEVIIIAFVNSMLLVGNSVTTV